MNFNTCLSKIELEVKLLLQNNKEIPKISIIFETSTVVNSFLIPSTSENGKIRSLDPAQNSAFMFLTCWLCVPFHDTVLAVGVSCTAVMSQCRHSLGAIIKARARELVVYYDPGKSKRSRNL